MILQSCGVACWWLGDGMQTTTLIVLNWVPTCYYYCLVVQTGSQVFVSSVEPLVSVSAPVCSFSPGWRRRESRDPPGPPGQQPPRRRWRHPWWCQSGQVRSASAEKQVRTSQASVCVGETLSADLFDVLIFFSPGGREDNCRHKERK